jgi:hypothetical protein
VSNPLSLAEAVAEIEKLGDDAQSTYDKGKDSYYSGMAVGFDYASSILARVTEVAELRAEVDRLNQENEALMTKLSNKTRTMTGGFDMIVDTRNATKGETKE